MRHPSSQALFAIWDKHRGLERAPYRSDLPPEIMRDLLGDIFVLNCDAGDGFPLRVAGTRVAALLGGEHTGEGLSDLFVPTSRQDLTELIREVAEELLVAVAGVTAVSNNGRSTSLELSLLPFRSRVQTPTSLIGLLVPMAPALLPLNTLSLTSWRYLGHPTGHTGPRQLRRFTMAQGLTVYEGLR